MVYGKKRHSRYIKGINVEESKKLVLRRRCLFVKHLNDLDVYASFALNLERLKEKIVMKSIEQRRQTNLDEFFTFEF